MLAIMENALQPTQRLFIITNAEPEIKIFFFLSYRGWFKFKRVIPLVAGSTEGFLFKQF